MIDDFYTRAALAAVGLALAAGPLGCFVLWRRMAYFGDATAHAAVLGVALSLGFSISLERLDDGVLLVRTEMPAPESKPPELSFVASLSLWLPRELPVTSAVLPCSVVMLVSSAHLIVCGVCLAGPAPHVDDLPRPEQGHLAVCVLVVALYARVFPDQLRVQLAKASLVIVVGILAALQRDVPRKHLFEMVLTGEKISAERARELGLVNRVSEAGKVMDEARALAAVAFARSSSPRFRCASASR